MVINNDMIKGSNKMKNLNKNIFPVNANNNVVSNINSSKLNQGGVCIGEDINMGSVNNTSDLNNSDEVINCGNMNKSEDINKPGDINNSDDVNNVDDINNTINVNGIHSPLNECLQNLDRNNMSVCNLGNVTTAVNNMNNNDNMNDNINNNINCNDNINNNNINNNNINNNNINNNNNNNSNINNSNSNPICNNNNENNKYKNTNECNDFHKDNTTSEQDQTKNDNNINNLISCQENTINNEEEKKKVYQLVYDLCFSEKRENALLELSRKRETYHDIAPVLWNSFGTITTLLQEIVSIYPQLSPPLLTTSSSNRVCNSLALLQCVASHPETKQHFLNAHIPLFLYPFLNAESKNRPFEYLRLTSLGVIGALVKVDNPEVINFLLQTEIIPLCLRIMETGSELSKTVATFIVQKILIDELGLNYICATPERFYAVSTVLANMVNSLVENPSSRLLKHIVRCYLRLSENARALEALKYCLPEPLRHVHKAFLPCLKEDPFTKKWLLQLLYNINNDDENPTMKNTNFINHNTNQNTSNINNQTINKMSQNVYTNLNVPTALNEININMPKTDTHTNIHNINDNIENNSSQSFNNKIKDSNLKCAKITNNKLNPDLTNNDINDNNINDNNNDNNNNNNNINDNIMNDNNNNNNNINNDSVNNNNMNDDSVNNNNMNDN
ncbi:cell differentiation protein rcd1, putative [Plasmodium reichenowi]|uniref:Cell differentiation protein rcd1, putative n=1 Tax=Plasmodium reichenowi TaxID=5854 RepID=A0A151LQV3_PLARE|nr:cell differentiation protein rcd1, putative [Plasmodium reichenowi]KYO01507.1 cell differentiation protein rcd1, putative [Plasmodium reichenowi]